jgi:hypothetical protein
MKPNVSDQDWGALRFRTPRTHFAINEKGVHGHRTDPPIRGVLFHMQTLSSFIARKARGVLHHTARTFQNSFRGLQ